MDDAGRKGIRAHPLEAFLAVLAALACTLITAAIWRSVSTYQETWPLPALYFIELPGLSILAAVAVLRTNPAARTLTWVCTGILLAFSILAGFSVGFLYLPIALLFGGAAVASDLRSKDQLAIHLAIALIAAAGQTGLMLAAI